MSEKVDELVQQIKAELQGFTGRHERKFAALQKEVEALGHHHDELQEAVEMSSLRGGSGGGQREDPEARGEMNSALREAMRSGDLSMYYRHSSIQNAMEVGSDPAGGYVVSPMLEPGIAQIARDVSPFRQFARIKTLTSADSWEEPASRDVAAASWAGEVESRAETAAPSLVLTRVPLCEIFAAPKITQKLLDTASFDVLAWLIESVGRSFAETEGAAFLTGNGVGKPRGLLTYTMSTADDDSRTWGEVQYVVSGANGAFAAAPNSGDVFYDCIGKLKTSYRQNARWLMSRATIAAVKKLKDSDGRFIWQDSLQAGQPPMLAGFPVAEDENMTAPATNSLSVAFGDYSQAYVIPEMPGLKLLMDPFTAKPYIVCYGYRRVGGGVRNFDAFKLIKLGTS